MSESKDNLRDQIVKALRTVKDPEIPINLYDLGLIYELDVRGEGAVHVQMTLTTPNCPVAESMPEMVRSAVAEVDGVETVDVQLVWEPAWTGEMMTEDARDTLEMMGISWRDPHSSAGQTSLTVGRTDRTGRKR